MKKIVMPLLIALSLTVTVDARNGDSGNDSGDSGKGDSGKGDSGKGDSGKGDSGKGDSGKGDSGKGDSGKGDSGKGDSGKGDSGRGGSGKITICHVPSGNPDNAHSIRISINGLRGHFDNSGKLHNQDYFGSCGHNEADNSVVQSESGESTPQITDNATIHVIAGCEGSYREALLRKTQEYLEPIVISDSSLDDDEERLIAFSECVDAGEFGICTDDSGKGDSGKGKGDSGKGDSGKGDSGKGDSGKGDSGKGKGDSGKGDSGKGDSGKGDSGKGDSGKGDSGNSCQDDSGDSGKGDSGKGKGRGSDRISDSGHHIIVMGCKNISDSGDFEFNEFNQDFRKRLKELEKDHQDNAYRTEDGTGQARKDKIPVIIPDNSLDDEDVADAVSNCLGVRNIADARDSGKGDSGKGDSGKGDSGKGDSGKGYRGKGDSGDSGKGDSGEQQPRIIYTHKGDSGNNFSVLIGCPGDSQSDVDSPRKELIDALADFREEQAVGCNEDVSEDGLQGDACSDVTLAPVILADSSYLDYEIKAAVDDCVDPSKGGGTDTEVNVSDGLGGRLNFRENKNPDATPGDLGEESGAKVGGGEL